MMQGAVGCFRASTNEPWMWPSLERRVMKSFRMKKVAHDGSDSLGLKKLADFCNLPGPRR